MIEYNSPSCAIIAFNKIKNRYQKFLFDYILVFASMHKIYIWKNKQLFGSGCL